MAVHKVMLLVTAMLSFLLVSGTTSNIPLQSGLAIYLDRLNISSECSHS